LVEKDGGTIPEVARHDESHTGRYLRDLLPDVDMDGPRADRRKPAKAASDD
jgi:excinuclease ABC subunit A